ncbi:hypothetical protein DMJ13_25835 [halophilic archaeon]|nr:hypothetical protein DMJ13_25835 [halophilic archaeon]
MFMLAKWLASVTTGINTESVTVVIDQLADLDPGMPTLAGIAVGAGGISYIWPVTSLPQAAFTHFCRSHASTCSGGGWYVQCRLRRIV